MSTTTYEGYLYESDTEEIASIRKRCKESVGRAERKSPTKSFVLFLLWVLTTAVCVKNPEYTAPLLVFASSVSLIALI